MNSNQREEFRYQFAGQALQGTLANGELMDSVKRVADAAQIDYKDAAASFAVEFADALIAKLDPKGGRP
jgi:hypothetical protein